jgi:hypothetical protein
MLACLEYYVVSPFIYIFQAIHVSDIDEEDYAARLLG